MADADEAVQQTEEERPSTEVVAERLGAAEAEGDVAQVQREVEFAAVGAPDVLLDAVIAIALTLLALELTTKILSAGEMNILRFGTYAGTQAIQYGIFTLIGLLIVRGQHVRAGTDLYRFHRGRIMTIAMAVCFAVSIPLYLVIGQLAFVLWAVVPIGTSLILRRLRPGTAARA